MADEQTDARSGDKDIVPGHTVYTVAQAGQQNAGSPAGSPEPDNVTWIAGTAAAQKRTQFAAATINGLLAAMEESPALMGVIRYNVLRRRPERMENGTWREWTDTDDKTLFASYQEMGIKSRQNVLDAFAIYLALHEVNPLTENIINLIPWDGQARCADFLTEVMGAPDDEYTHECSRLLFAGGIHRLYHPGCKVDQVIVLIGDQGGGKSTICRWLAMDDAFFRELDTIEGREGVEVLQGCWIAEISEMLATTKTREVEAVKSYITRQTDAYREPYARRVTDIPRRCIFIGTSNNPQFLTDKTGNRRFFPVRTTITGAALFEVEDAVRAYIAQCWAEAREKIDTDEMKPVPRPELLTVIKEHQAAALEDDWRTGMIKSYLDTKRPGDVTCTIEIWEHALGFDREQKPMTKKDSTELGQILRSFVDWINTGRSEMFPVYGKQRVWKKIGQELSFPPGEMPFGKKEPAQNPNEPPPPYIL